MSKLYVVRIDEPKISDKDYSIPLCAAPVAEYTAMQISNIQKLAAKNALANQWPKYVEVPDSLSHIYLNSSNNPAEEWMKKEVLPMYPNSVCTLLVQEVKYNPATHTKE